MSNMPILGEDQNEVLTVEMGVSTNTDLETADKGVLGPRKRVRRSRGANSKDNDVEDAEILEAKDAERVFDKKWCVADLKRMCKHYKLKVGGTKSVLQGRLYLFLKRSVAANCLAVFVKRALSQEWLRCHGPALFDRSNVTNDVDFATLDNVRELGIDVGFSFMEGTSCFMFDVESFRELLNNSNQWVSMRHSYARKIKNPFTRAIINDDVISSFNSLVSLGKAFGRYVTDEVDSQMDSGDGNMNANGNGNGGGTGVSGGQSVGQSTGVGVGGGVDVAMFGSDESLSYFDRLTSVFDVMDSYGHYTNPEWLSSLSRTEMRTFIVRLYDIVMFRVGLSRQSLMNILPPSGQFIDNVTYRAWLQQLDTASPDEMTRMLKNMVVTMCRKLVCGGVDQASRELGAMYVLMACTIVSSEAREAMPWLYESLQT